MKTIFKNNKPTKKRLSKNPINTNMTKKLEEEFNLLEEATANECHSRDKHR